MILWKPIILKAYILLNMNLYNLVSFFYCHLFVYTASPSHSYLQITDSRGLSEEDTGGEYRAAAYYPNWLVFYIRF
jgi:hypothetical protein